MNKLTSRLLIFFIGIPVVVFCVWLPYLNHLLFQCVVLAVATISTIELYNIFSVKYKMMPKLFTIIACVSLPFASIIHCMWPFFTGGVRMPVSGNYWTFVLIGVILVIFLMEIITAKEFEGSNIRLAGTVFIIFYIGYIFTFILRMTELQSVDGKNLTTPLVITFLLLVFLCDSIAWLFGVTMGKNNRGIVRASPNKSIAGFVGGFVGSIGTAFICRFLFPAVFANNIPFWKTIILGACIAFTSIVGDLTESIFKRSAGVKDSGHIIVGRGGLLDSIDSILVSAPLYYLLIVYLYNANVIVG